MDGASGGVLTACTATRQILQGVPNNYETDLIFPIVACAARLAGLEYAAATPKQRAALKVPPGAPQHDRYSMPSASALL